MGIVQNAMDPKTGATKTPFDTGTQVGSLSTAIGAPTVYSSTTEKMAPALRTVDPAKETVAGQLHSILNEDSPVLQQARSRAMDTANSRGLLNTSMAAGAGESAVIDAAMPIASADASVYNANAAANQGYENTASQVNAGAANTSNAAATQAANATQLSAQQSMQDTAMQKLKGEQATGLANIEAQYKNLMQTNAGAAQMFSVVTNNIGAILADPNTSAEQKQAAVDHQTQMLQLNLAVSGAIANLDLVGLLDFSVPV
jgi:hypothetical protein